MHCQTFNSRKLLGILSLTLLAIEAYLFKYIVFDVQVFKCDIELHVMNGCLASVESFIYVFRDKYFVINLLAYGAFFFSKFDSLF